MLLLGSLEPIELDVPRIAARFAQPTVASALTAAGIGSPAALLATWITDRAGLETYVAGAPPVTDDRPRIEYAGWVRGGEFGRVLPRLLSLRREPPLLGADDAFRAAVATEQRRLAMFYEASLHYYAGERAQMAPLLDKLFSEDGQNPYYR